MNAISTKKVWIRTDGWRGYEQPINAVAGANDTGTWSGSPCDSNLRKKEIDLYLAKLRKAGIRYKTIWTRTSNVFCNAQKVLVSPQDKEKAFALAKEHESETVLFYSIKV